MSSLNGTLVRPHDIRVGRNPDMAIAAGDDSVQATGVLKATIDALTRLKDPEKVARLRGKSVAEILGVEKDKEPEKVAVPAVTAAPEAPAPPPAPETAP